MCQVHIGPYVSLLAPGKTDYTAGHPRKTPTYMLNVVPITTYTHDRRKPKRSKEKKMKERKEKTRKRKNRKGKARKENTRKARKDKTRRESKGIPALRSQRTYKTDK